MNWEIHAMTLRRIAVVLGPPAAAFAGLLAMIALLMTVPIVGTIVLAVVIVIALYRTFYRDAALRYMRGGRY